MTIQQQLIDFWNTAIGNKTGWCGILTILIPYLNPILQSHGWPTFVNTVTQANPIPMIGTTTTTTPGALGYALVGATLIAIRAAWKKMEPKAVTAVTVVPAAAVPTMTRGPIPS